MMIINKKTASSTQVTLTPRACLTSSLLPTRPNDTRVKDDEIHCATILAIFLSCGCAARGASWDDPPPPPPPWLQRATRTCKSSTYQQTWRASTYRPSLTSSPPRTGLRKAPCTLQTTTISRRLNTTSSSSSARRCNTKGTRVAGYTPFTSTTTRRKRQALTYGDFPRKWPRFRMTGTPTRTCSTLWSRTSPPELSSSMPPLRTRR